MEWATLVFGAGGLTILIWQEVRHWRSRPFVQWVVHRLGTATLPANDEQWSVIEVVNFGSGDANVLAAEIHGVEHRDQWSLSDGIEGTIPTRMQAGERVKLLVALEGWREGWIRIIWITPHDTWTRVEWHPFDPQSDIAKAEEKRQASLKRPKWLRWLPRRPERGVVEPGGASSVRLRQGRRRTPKRIHEAMGVDPTDD